MTTQSGLTQKMRWLRFDNLYTLNRRKFLTTLFGGFLAAMGHQELTHSCSGEETNTKRRLIEIVEAPSILGLFPKGVEMLCQALISAGLAESLHARIAKERVVPPSYNPVIDPTTHILNARSISTYTSELANAVSKVLDAKDFALVLGGDCSIMLGGLLALRRRGRYGLLFIDGHADFYQPMADPSGGASSMELGLATGRGPEILTRFEGLQPLVREQDVVIFGRRDARSAQEAGSQRVEDTAIHRIELPKIRRRGAAASAAEAMEHLTSSSLDGFWVHLDCDVLDELIMPAVDYKTPGGGLTYGEVSTVLQAASATGKFLGMEVTMFNPKLDADGSLARKLVDMLRQGLTHAPTA